MFVGRIFIMNQYFRVTTPRYTVFHHFHMKFVNFASITPCEFDFVIVRKKVKCPQAILFYIQLLSHTHTNKMKAHNMVSQNGDACLTISFILINFTHSRRTTYNRIRINEDFASLLAGLDSGTPI